MFDEVGGVYWCGRLEIEPNAGTKVKAMPPPAPLISSAMKKALVCPLVWETKRTLGMVGRVKLCRGGRQGTRTAF